MKVIARALLLGALLVSVLPAQPTLDNDAIIKVVKAGLSDDVVVGMITNQPGLYAVTPDDVISLKNAGVSDRVIAAMVNKGAKQPVQTALGPISVAPAISGELLLHDGTPVRMRLARNLSSADAQPGETVDFEVLEDLKVDDVLVVAKGATAIATITEAEHKKRMGRGGKLSLTIDYVRLLNGDKAALRAVKESRGGGHTGAMTGGIVATAFVLLPAAPFFLFMHGKDTTIPKGTEITAYINGDIKIPREKMKPSSPDAIQKTTEVSPPPATGAKP